MAALGLNRQAWSWALYDWASSAFATTVMAGFFPVFFKEFWSAGVDATVSTLRLGTAISAASLVFTFPGTGSLAKTRRTSLGPTPRSSPSCSSESPSRVPRAPLLGG